MAEERRFFAAIRQNIGEYARPSDGRYPPGGAWAVENRETDGTRKKFMFFSLDTLPPAECEKRVRKKRE